MDGRDETVYGGVLGIQGARAYQNIGSSSCHSYGAMETAATSAWVDVLLARINPAGIRCDGDRDEVLRGIASGERAGDFCDWYEDLWSR